MDEIKKVCDRLLQLEWQKKDGKYEASFEGNKITFRVDITKQPYGRNRQNVLLLQCGLLVFHENYLLWQGVASSYEENLEILIFEEHVAYKAKYKFEEQSRMVYEKFRAFMGLR